MGGKKLTNPLALHYQSPREPRKTINTIIANMMVTTKDLVLFVQLKKQRESSTSGIIWVVNLSRRPITRYPIPEFKLYGIVPTLQDLIC
jgi:hypothetical protein